MKLKKALAAVVVLALVLVSPGLECYAVAGEIFSPESSAEFNAIVPVAGDLGALNPGAVGADNQIPNDSAATFERLRGQSADSAQSGVSGIEEVGANVGVRENPSFLETHPEERPGSSGNGSSALPGIGRPAALSNPNEGPRAAAEPSSSQESPKARGFRKFVQDIAAAWNKKAPEAMPVDAASAANEAGAPVSGLTSAVTASPASGLASPPPNPPTPGAPSGSSRDFLSRLHLPAPLATALGAGFVLGIQYLSTFLSPTLFHIIPAAAIWGLSPGIFVLPMALYMRYRWLARRDSPRLNTDKLLLDLGIGAYLGGFWLLPHLGLAALVAFTMHQSLAVLAVPAVSALGTALSLWSGTGGQATDKALAGITTIGFSMLLHSVSTIGIGLGPLFAMVVLPALMTQVFFNGRIVMDAETGKAFDLPPGPMGTAPARFPAYNWLMLGVIFSVFSGFASVPINLWITSTTSFNAAVFAWMIWGEKANFNYMYGALAALALFAGLSSPLGHMALGVLLMFAPDRARAAMEWFNKKMLPQSAPAVSSHQPAQKIVQADEPVHMPKTSYWLRTISVLATMTSMVAFAPLFFGSTKLVLDCLLLGVALSGLTFIFSRQLIKRFTGATPIQPDPTKPGYDPNHVIIKGVLQTVLNQLNANRRATHQWWQGRYKDIPMLNDNYIVIDHSDGPNAYATGPSPFHAMVGVTQGMIDMLFVPENLKRYLMSVAQSSNPDDIKFWAYRKQLARFIPAVASLGPNAGPQSVAQAIERASDQELLELGKDLLAAVLSHEWSHERYHHMLIGSVAGAQTMALSNAAYGWLWGVSHPLTAMGLGLLISAAGYLVTFNPIWGMMMAGSVLFGLAFKLQNIKAKKALAERLKSKSVSSPSSSSASAQQSVIQEIEPQMVDPGTIAIIIKEIPEFMAIWSPVVMQLLQMASSRNDESQADNGGATITGHPESLAVALQLLINWRPKQKTLDSLAQDDDKQAALKAFSPIYTMNPLEQLKGKVQGPQDAARATEEDGPQVVLGRGEDLWSDLEATHPDTDARIVRLARMAKAMEEAKPARPAPPPASRPAAKHDPPKVSMLSSGVVAPASGRGSFLKRLWERLKKFFRIFPDAERNHEFWLGRLAQIFANIGATFGSTAQVDLFSSKQMTGIKVGTDGAQLTANITTDSAISNRPLTKTLFETYLGRGLLLQIPAALFFLIFRGSIFPYSLLFAIILGVEFLASAGVIAVQNADVRINGPDSSYFNRANAADSLAIGLAMIPAPAVAGALIAFCNIHLGPMSGDFLAFGVYGLAAIASALIYRKLKLADGASPGNGWKEMTLADFIKEIASGLYALPGRIIHGIPHWKEDLAQQAKQTAQGFRKFWNIRFLRLFLFFSTPSLMLADPLPYLAIPAYIKHVLRAFALPAFVAHLPLIGPWIPNFSGDTAAVFGLFLSVSNFGAMIPNLIMMFWPQISDFYRKLRGKPAQERTGMPGAWPAAHGIVSPRKGLFFKPQIKFNAYDFMEKIFPWGPSKDLTPLQRQAFWSSLLEGAGGLVAIGLFLTPHIGLALLALTLSSILTEPAVIIWASLEEESLSKQAPENQAQIISAMNTWTQVAGIIGALGFGAVLGYFSVQTAFMVFKVAMGVSALAAIIQPFKIFQKQKPELGKAS